MGKFKKWQSGNPNGRPKKEDSITDLVRKQADIEIEPGKTYAQAIAEKLLKLASGGDIAAIKYAMDRMDGSPKQTQLIDLNANHHIDTEFDIVEPNEDTSETTWAIRTSKNT